MGNDLHQQMNLGIFSMIRYSTIRLIMVSSLNAYFLTFVGCDAEAFIPNDELVPAEISALDAAELSITFSEAGADISSSEGFDLNDSQKKKFIEIMKAAHRNSVPTGFSDAIYLVVKEVATTEVLARFRFSIRQPFVTNDGREYDVSGNEVEYFGLISDLLHAEPKE